MKNNLIFFIFIVSFSLFIPSCANIDPANLDYASLGASAFKVGKAFGKAMEDFTPEQEYYIGRTVGAIVLQKYKPYKNTRVNKYINLLGQTLSKASDMPETFAGYHFLVTDSNEINAFAAPGGLIFVTRGMLRCCQSESAVAAVLAHEIGHVQLKHGMDAIDTSRKTEVVKTLAAETVKQLGPQEVASLTNAFEGVVGDIASKMINNGYSRGFEKDADQAAITILKRVGYNPNALVDMLKIMQKRLKPGGLDFAKTHPSPEKRIAYIQDMIGENKAVKPNKTRQKRFKKALRAI